MNKPSSVNFFRAFDELRDEARTEDAVPLISALLLLHVLDRYDDHFAALGLALPDGAAHDLQQSLRLSVLQVDKYVQEVLRDRVHGDLRVLARNELNAPAVARASRAVAQEVQQATSGLPAEAGLAVLGAAYSQMLDYVVRQFSKGGYVQTPESVAQLMAALLDAGPGMRVLDFTSGLARTLVEVARRERELGRDPNQLVYVGQEVSAEMALLGAVHLVVNNVVSFRLHVDDTLLNPRTTQGEFDRVIADPPLTMAIPHLAGRLEQDDRFVFGKRKLPRAAEWLFLQHGLTSLKPGGRAIFVTAPGPMYRGGTEAAIRHDVLSTGWLNTVMALPSGLYPNTGLPVVLTQFDRPAPGQPGHPDVLMLDAGSLGRRQGRTQVLDDDTRAYLVTAVQERQAGAETATLVAHEQIRGNENAWQPNQYVSRAAQDTPRTLDEIRRELSDQQQVLRDAERQLEEALTALRQLQS